MRVIFYGRLADVIAPEIDFPLVGTPTVAELRTRLDHAFPGAGLADRRVRACVAGTVVGDETVLAPDQQVEILAPVSGG